jgi:hypothetical protein
MADTAARLAISARRNEVLRFTVAVAGIDLTGVAMNMQVRLARGTPGAPLIQLGTVTTASAEGLKFDGVTVVGGVPTSIIKGRINKTTMDDQTKVPYSGEQGSDTVLAYAMQWTLNGDPNTRLEGDFIVRDTAYGSDNAPANRAASYGGSQYTAGGSGSGTLTFGDQVIAVSIASADLIGIEVAKAQAAAAQAIAAAGSAGGAASDANVVAVGTDLRATASKIAIVATDLLLGATSKILAVGTDLLLGATSKIANALGYAQRAEAAQTATVAALPSLRADIGTLGIGNSRSASMLPIVSVGGDVPLWLEEGLLNAVGLAPSLVTKVGASLPFGSATSLIDASMIPLVTVGSDVAVWLDKGKLAAAGVSDALITTIVSQINGFVPTSASPSRGAMAIRTDGRSLRKYARKKNTFAVSGTGVLTVAQIGDSWTQFSAIPQDLANLHYADMAKSAPGWLSVGHTLNNGGYFINGVTFARSDGWTLFDGAPLDFSRAVPPRACGPDIFALYTTTATASLTLGNWRATQITIYYWNGNGSFRYRIDGGVWTTITGTGANAKAKVTVSALPDVDGAGKPIFHTLDIDTSGNTGTVEIYGFNALSPSTPGVVFHQIGNGSARGINYTDCKAHLAYFAADLAIDLAYVLLGTNDYNASAGTTSYATGITDIVQGLCPAAGIVVCSPARCKIPDSPPAISQVQYRDAAYQLATQYGWEFFNAYDAWEPYEVEKLFGMWSDELHLGYNASNAGSRRYAKGQFATIKEA